MVFVCVPQNRTAIIIGNTSMVNYIDDRLFVTGNLWWFKHHQAQLTLPFEGCSLKQLGCIYKESWWQADNESNKWCASHILLLEFYDNRKLVINTVCFDCTVCITWEKVLKVFSIQDVFCLNRCRLGKEDGVYFILAMENCTFSIMKMRKNRTQDVQKIPYSWKSAWRSLLTLNILSTIMFSH